MSIQGYIVPRRDTAANYTANNPVLVAGELATESDTGKIKLGDGSTAWTGLGYYTTGGGVSDGDKGDIVVSGAGTVFSIDTGVATTAGRAVMAGANAAAQRTSLGLVIGTDVQAHTAVLDANDASFTAAKDSKLAGIAAGAEVNVNADWTSGAGDSQILNKPTLGTAAAQNTTDFEAAGAIATHAAITTTHGISAFGATLVDDAAAVNARATLGLVIGTDVQAHTSVLDGTTASYTTALDTKLGGIATGAEVNVNADWNSVAGDSQILNKPTLGTAAAQNTTAFEAAGGIATHAALTSGVHGLGTLSQVTPTGTPDGTNYLRDDNRWAIPAPLTVQDFGDPFVLPDTSALTIPLRFAVSDANRLTAKAGARLSVLGTNPVLLGYYALGSCQIDADAYALQYKRASLLGSARATVIGTGELFVFDLAPVGRLVLAGRGG